MITRIVVHHSASPHGRGDNAQTIHQWHLEKGWWGIGYHWVITESGDVQAGRPWYWEGSHVRGFNEDSLGVCLIGNGSFTRLQMDSLKTLLRKLLEQHPDAVVVGHRDLDEGTECPGFEVRDVMESVLAKKTRR